jgi:hypothetical protein
MESDKIFRFSEDFLPLVCQYLPFASRLEGSHSQATPVFDDTPDGGRFGTREVLLDATRQQQRVQLLLSEVGVLLTQSFDLTLHTPIIPTLPFLLGSTRAAVERLELALSFLEFLLPEVQRSLLHAVRLFDRGEPVCFPKPDNLCPLLCFFGHHIREPYRVFLCRSRTFDSSIYAENAHVPSL